jgi:Uma2 family endonuclease
MNQPATFAETWQRPARFSVAEYGRMLDAGAFQDMRVELVEGELVRMSPAHSAHGRLHSRLHARLAAVLEKAGISCAIDLASVAGPDTVLGPDIAALAPGAAESGMVDASDILLAVEIADSSLGRDLGEKQRAYARAGVPHYWVVDVEAGVTHAMSSAAENGYRERVVIPFAQPLPVPGTKEAIRLD